jgi:hypothetical protein
LELLRPKKCVVSNAEVKKNRVGRSKKIFVVIFIFPLLADSFSAAQQLTVTIVSSHVQKIQGKNFFFAFVEKQIRVAP